MRAEFSKAIADEGPVEALKHTESAVAAPARPVVVEAKETAVQDKLAPVTETKVSITDEEYEQAVKALRFAKYTTKDFEVLGHDRVVALGKEHHRSQAEVSKRFEESAARVKALEEAAATRTTERLVEFAKTPTVDFQAAVKLTAKAILDAENPEDALTKFHEASTAPIHAELRETKQFLNQIVGVVFELQADRARGQLPERVRELVDDKLYSEVVLPKAKKWMAAGERASVADAIYDASMDAVRKTLNDEALSAQTRKSVARENGQLSPVERRPTAKPKNSDDRLREAFRAASQSGATEADVRAALTG